MLGLPKKKPFTADEFQKAVDDVRRRMTEGEYVSGAQAAAALRKSVEAKNGAHTTMWAEAHLLEARVALTLGDVATGLDHMREATKVEGDDDDAIHARLTNQLNLGELLAEMGEFEEAEQTLRDALEARRAQFGDESHEFGVGAEKLGTLLLTRGAFDEAQSMGGQAVRALRDDSELGEAGLILWLTAAKAAKPEQSALELLPADQVDAALHALADADATRVIPALLDLRWEVYGRLDEPTRKRRCLNAIATESAVLDRHDDRIRALRALVELAEGASEDEAANALQRLALALDEAGQPEEANQTYELALQRAGEAKPRVLRNFAIYQAAQGFDDRADALFREGVALATGEAAGRIAGAYGVFLHHREHFEEALVQLRRCIEQLPEAHTDRLIALAHVEAAERHERCACELT